jgi:Ca2+-binding RTX toxin-like protein
MPRAPECGAAFDGGSGNDRLFGNNGHDRLSGRSGNNSLDGGAGDDRLFGGSDNDTLLGGSGNDVLRGGTGNDTAFGGEGTDSFTWNPGDGDDVFDGGGGTDTLIFNGSDGAERMTITTLANGGFQFFRDLGSITVDATTVERIDVDGLGGNDSIDASAQTNAAVALEITGGDGNDPLIGGAGNNSILGDAGNDSVDGGAGNDTLTGGLGGDTFVFGSATANGVTETDGNLQLTLAGGDNDIVVVQGITIFADVTII